jgi:hypothetical protein
MQTCDQLTLSCFLFVHYQSKTTFDLVFILLIRQYLADAIPFIEFIIFLRFYPLYQLHFSCFIKIFLMLQAFRLFIFFVKISTFKMAILFVSSLEFIFLMFSDTGMWGLFE